MNKAQRWLIRWPLSLNLTTFKAFTVDMVECSTFIEMLLQRSFWYQMCGIVRTLVKRRSCIFDFAFHQMIGHPVIWYDMLFVVRARNPILFVWTVHGLLKYRLSSFYRMEIFCSMSFLFVEEQEIKIQFCQQWLWYHWAFVHV